MAVSKATKMMLSLTLIGIIGTVLSQEIPEDWSHEEIVEMFPTVANKEYEIVTIEKPRLHKRGLNQGFHLRFKAFGNELKLWLNPAEGILASDKTPVWNLISNHELNKQPDGYMQNMAQRMYTTNPSSATMFIEDVKQGKVRLYGSIGNNQYYVQPVLNNNRRFRRSTGNNTETASDFSYHIVYKMPDVRSYLNPMENPLSRIFKTQGNGYNQVNRYNQGNQIQTVYPEIMVVIDYSLYEKLQKSLDIAVQYTLAFFNAVDLKYRALDSPKYRLNIAGIIVVTQPFALEFTSYVYRNEPRYLDGDLTLKGATKWMGWFGEQIGQDSFDTSITLTSWTLCTDRGGVCSPGSIGYANVGLTCQPIANGNDPFPLRSGNGVVHDNGDFEGIRTTAHELAHLFGVNHDGETMKTRNCNSNEGHIMTPVVKFTDNGSEWSYCSLKEFENFLNSNPYCLFNQPKTGNVKMTRFLPGQLMDADAQCKNWLGTRAWEINADSCQMLKCVHPQNPNGWTREFEAAEGTRCGPNSICLHGKCVDVRYIQ